MSCFRIIFVFLIIFFGCDTYNLDGRWDDSSEIELNGGDNIQFLFHNDSFYYSYEMWGDVLSNRPCDDDKEYAAGKYFFKGDSLILKGVWLSKSCHNKDSLHVIYRCSVEDFKYVLLNLINAGYDNNYSKGIKPKVVLTRKGHM